MPAQVCSGSRRRRRGAHPMSHDMELDRGRGIKRGQAIAWAQLITDNPSGHYQYISHEQRAEEWAQERRMEAQAVQAGACSLCGGRLEALDAEYLRCSCGHLARVKQPRKVRKAYSREHRGKARDSTAQGAASGACGGCASAGCAWSVGRRSHEVQVLRPQPLDRGVQVLRRGARLCYLRVSHTRAGSGAQDRWGQATP
jgi:hypothetical protein